jgi:hypothetical protein
LTVGPSAQTCAACHSLHFNARDRVSGPKGIAFLTLPGLDLASLKRKGASIGEWPSASDAGLTPFMKVLISRSERGRILLKAVDGLNLQDLSDASDEQIRAVAKLAWEIKGLFYGLVKGTPSGMLDKLDLGGGAQLDASLISDLVASMPRDVVDRAHRQWLPSLGKEMANRQDADDQGRSSWMTTISEGGLAAGSTVSTISGSDLTAR